MRLVPQYLPSLVSLGLPEAAEELALRPHGLVLVTGPSGSGKSTTLAAMIDLVNRQRAGHIVSLEDPIEYLHQSRRCLIHQREIGTDSQSFASALRHVLRQDPDVVMIGELRDSESIAIALTAAETGRLVLGTLHTQGAAKSIDRIIDSFPSGQQNQVRAQLGETLQGVISQVLLPRSDGSGRVLATEVLMHTDAVANLIRAGQVPQLQTVMQTSSKLRMHTLDQSLQSLVRRGLVDRGVAREYASDQAALAAVIVGARFSGWSGLAAGRVKERSLTMAAQPESFSYQAVDRGSGAVVRGTLEALSESAVVAKLHAQGLVPLEVRLVSTSGKPRAIQLFASAPSGEGQGAGTVRPPTLEPGQRRPAVDAGARGADRPDR